MAGSYIKQVKNENHQDPYIDQKQVTVEPEETQRVTSVSAPDAQTQQFMQQNAIRPLQQAYGIDPNPGKATPFEVLGYNPEEERRRREAEKALNDRKRKENAWYNAFAVVGDALTAGLGGNVWKRQPNNIGAQANADNQRLIAEQKADDMRNAAMVRNAGIDYANNVNRLIQNYLTRTTDTVKTGGNRLEITQHGAQNGWRQQSHALGSASSGSGGGDGYKIININTGNRDKGNFAQNGYHVTKAEYDAVSDLVRSYYNKLLNQRGADGQLTRHAEDMRQKLLNAGVLNKSVAGSTKDIEQNAFDSDMILRNGEFWDLDDPIMTRIEKATKGKVKFKRHGWEPTSSSSSEIVDLV